MTSPHWNPLELVKVPASPEDFWTLAIEFVPGSRLLRICVTNQDKDGNHVPTKWKIGGQDVGPNGLISSNSRTSYLCPGAYQGALVGKLGGSTADIVDPGQTSAPYGSKKVFVVGSSCIIAVADGDAGPLYLTINDDPSNLGKNSGALWVRIDEAPR